MNRTQQFLLINGCPFTGYVIWLFLVCPVFLSGQEAVVTYTDGTESVEYIHKEKKKKITALSRKTTKDKVIWRSKISDITYTDTPVLNLNSNGRYEYIRVIEAQGPNKDELHSSLNSYVAERYNSAQDVIQMNDNNKIVGKGIWEVYGHRFGVNFRMESKEEKYRLTFSNFDLIQATNGEPEPIESDIWTQPKRYWLALSRHINEIIIPDIQNYINSEAGDEW